MRRPWSQHKSFRPPERMDGLAPANSGIAEASPSNPCPKAQRNDVLSIRKDDAADSYHVHAADGLPDDGERVMPDFLAGISVHLGVFDAMASLSVDLVEADFLEIRSGRIQSDRTGNKRKAQKAFPVGAGRPARWKLKEAGN